MKTMKAYEITARGYYWLRDNHNSRWRVVEASKWNGRMVLLFTGWEEVEELDGREVMGPITPPEES